MTSEPMASAFPEESDSTLVAATKNGKIQAFEFLMKRHQAKTLSLAFRITRNREDAQDVVQQSFHKAYMHLDRFQGKSSFSTVERREVEISWSTPRSASIYSSLFRYRGAGRKEKWLGTDMILHPGN